VSCQNSLGVGAVVPPIINAFNGSSSALETGDIKAIGAQANSAMIKARRIMETP
jgi:hypothetical protein